MTARSQRFKLSYKTHDQNRPAQPARSGCGIVPASGILTHAVLNLLSDLPAGRFELGPSDARVGGKPANREMRSERRGTATYFCAV
jgi:hypothetical protein